jgi:wyosine [tRNA(Phe)-imidazoG37] synthetase (radical SAM superfamily)
MTSYLYIMSFLNDLNDIKQELTQTELTEIRNLILRINPDLVQLNTLDRPGTVPDIHGATRDELHRIVDFLKLDNVEIIAASPARKNIQSYRNVKKQKLSKP